MAIVDVKIMGEPEFIQKSQPVTEFDASLQQLIQNLTDTMAAEGGVGIAAPQIGVNKRVMLIGFDKNDRYPYLEPVPFTVLVNPEYQPLSDELVDGWEGCLSVPGLRGLVPRYRHIRYRGYDEKGNLIERTVSDVHARIVQHELDHLDGRLFPSRIKNFANFGFESVLLGKIRESHGKFVLQESM